MKTYRAPPAPLPQVRAATSPQEIAAQINSFFYRLRALPPATKSSITQAYSESARGAWGRAAATAAYCASDAKFDNDQRASARDRTADTIGDGDGPTTWAAQWPANEIQGQDNIHQFFFLPLFGISTPSAIS